MIIYSCLNYRSLDRRLKKLEDKLANASGSKSSIVADSDHSSDDQLLELIAGLPPENRVNAEKILEEERRGVEAARENIRQIAHKMTTNSEGVSVGIFAMDRKRRLVRYLVNGRLLEHAEDALLRELWTLCYRKSIATQEQFYDHEAGDAEVELSLRGLAPPVELIKEELDAAARKRVHLPSTDQNFKVGYDALIAKIASDDQRGT